LRPEIIDFRLALFTLLARQCARLGVFGKHALAQRWFDLGQQGFYQTLLHSLLLYASRMFDLNLYWLNPDRV
jgi:hypothetical protein